MTDTLSRDFLPLLTYAAGSDIGLRREENQDAFGLLETDQFRFFVVADGMGGAQGGAEASQLAVAAIRGFLAGEVSLNVDGVREALEAANKTIFERSLTDSNLMGMGTTVVGLGFGPHGMLVCNVGDSRAFRIRAGKVGQMTLDHTLVQELVDAGTISEAQAERHPVAHMLTRSLGPADMVAVDCWMYPEQPEPGDAYVLCSDGLYNLVPPLEIAEIVLFNEGHDAVAKLIDLANNAGGSDNITVMIVRIGPTTKVPVLELEVERIPQRPVVEEPSPGGEHDGGLQAGEGAASTAESTDQEALHSAAFRALSGAFQSPDMWHVRTAVWDARNIIIGGGVGLVLLFVVWLFKPEVATELSPQAPLDERVWSGVPAGRLVSASLKANIPAHIEQRRAELRAELNLVEELLDKKRGEQRDAFLAEHQRELRTKQVRYRSTIIQLRQELASLIEARRTLPASPVMLVSFAESFEEMNDEIKAAREAAIGPVWKYRQAGSASVNSGSDSKLAPLREQVREVDQKLRQVLTAELGKRVMTSLQELRSELGRELETRMRSELVERLRGGGGDFDRKDGTLEQYRTELAALLTAP